MMTSKKSVLVALSIALLAPGLYADTKDTKKVEKKAESKAAATKNDVNTNIRIGDVLVSDNVKTDLNIRCINTMEAMQTSQQGMKISTELDAKRQKLSEEIKKQDEIVQTAKAEFQSKQSTLSKTARGAEEAKINKMLRDYETTLKTCEDELKLAMQDATEVLSQEVEKNVTKIAQANKHDIVWDVFTGKPIYVSPSAMVTGDLIKEMDASYKVAEAKVEKKAGTKTA